MDPISHSQSPEFRRLLRGDDQADLARIAFEVARDAYPNLNASTYLGRIDALAERARDRCRDGANLKQILGQINWVLFAEEGLRGDEESYYDARNSYLNEVLDRRLGIPLSLSVLYLAVADRLGLVMSGVNLPAHFVIRAGRGRETLFVDPFHEGRLLDRSGCERQVAEVTGQAVELADSHFAPCSTAAIVARMLRNLKATYLRAGEFTAAVPVLRRLAALERHDPIESRDLGATLLRAGLAAEAIPALETYLQAAPGNPDADDVAALLRAARREFASWN